MNTGYFYHHYSCLEIEEYKIGPSFRWLEDGGTLKDILKSGEISDLWWKKSVNSFLEVSMTFLNTSAVYSVSIHVEVFYVDIFSINTALLLFFTHMLILTLHWFPWFGHQFPPTDLQAEETFWVLHVYSGQASPSAIPLTNFYQFLSKVT